MQQSLLLFLKTNRKHLLELLLASLLINVFMLALPLFTMLVYDKGMGNKVHDTLWALSIGMVLLLCLELVMRSARVYLVEHAGARWDAFLDERLIRGVLNAPLTANIPAADVLSGMREVSTTRDVLSAQSLLAVADIPFALLFVVVIALVGGDMVWIPLLFGAIMAAMSAWFQHASVVRQRRAVQSARQKMTLLVDVLSARDSLYGRPTSRGVEATYRKHAQEGARAAARGRWWMQLNQQMVPVLLSLSAVIVLVAGVFKVEAQLLSVGGLISVTMLSSRFISTLVTVAPLWTRWNEFTDALNRLGKAVDLKTPPVVGEQKSTTAFATEGVRLNDLSFSYPGNPRPVIDALTLHLRPGELVALVGGTGAGKSTLLRILGGQLPHTGGQLVFGAHVVGDDASRMWMCQQVHHKPQDPTFMGGTLRDVVAAGAVTADDDKLVQALRSVGFGVMLEQGDAGLNTVIGTNGLGLSGGQRQMVALAASFHGNHPVLLLDEPTLGLDRLTQQKVIDTLPSLKAGRCIVVATHAAELIAVADRMVVLDRGRIIADGSPAKLLGVSAPIIQTSAAAPVRQ